MGFFRVTAIPLGYLMKLCYYLIQNYAIALIVFTFIIRLILFPINIKQQKSTAKMQKFAPEMEKLKKKYGKDKDKLNEATVKFYAENGISPTSSCLPMLILMLILMSMIEVIYAPLTYVSSLSDTEIDKATTRVESLMTFSHELSDAGITFNELYEDEVTDADKAEEQIQAYLENNKGDFEDTLDLSSTELSGVIENMLSYKDTDPLDVYFNDSKRVSTKLENRKELILMNMVQEDGFGGVFDENTDNVISEFHYEIFGQNLGQYPKMWTILMIVPILSFLAQLASTIVSMHYMRKNNAAAASNPMMKNMNLMMYVMPVFSLVIAFQFPMGLGIYWTISALLGLVQTIAVNKIYTPAYVDKLVEKEISQHKERSKTKKTFMQKALEASMETKQGGAEASETADGDDDAEEDEEDIDESKLSKRERNELNRKRLNEARRRMAEKYGDEYFED